MTRVNAVVCVGFLAGLLASRRLWFDPHRLYPLASALPGGPRVPAGIDLVCVGGLGVLLIAAACRVRPVASVRLGLALTAALVTFDQSRLQPWVYQYGVILAVLSFAAWSTPMERRNRAVLTTSRFVVVALYFWSAVQKANPTFLRQTWVDFSAAAVAMSPRATGPVITGLGVLVPGVELLVAIGLATVRFRRYAVYAAVAMHAGILALLLLARENSVVWPWNLVTATLTVLLFRGSDEAATTMARNPGFVPHRVIVLLVGFMPVFSFFGWWDPYLSAALYSGNAPQAVVEVVPGTVERLPAVVRSNTWQASRPMFIDLNRWSYEELNVPAYPAERVLRQIGRDVCRTYVQPDAGALRVLDRPSWWSGARRSTVYDCATAGTW